MTDEPEYIDYEHMARIDRFIVDVATHVVNLDHRVVVDHSNPIPTGSASSRTSANERVRLLGP